MPRVRGLIRHYAEALLSVVVVVINQRLLVEELDHDRFPICVAEREMLRKDRRPVY
eukprot:CAMPEP_0182466250 /NCGR_PEP_ID=MMETSP1319-20130603/11663_1 /TAXON_ID=172717 /ORGANISM="Bolidomonas pacifica, Strain RCC208" /LENGTH=55 /DNA_ID=CAMNT_0024666209 /DNA_START=367 /DNA_END=534 /DNA_ORIENTATION=+